MNPGAVGGKIYVKADGEALPVAGNVTIGHSDTEVAVKTGLSGGVGYSETHRPPFIEVEAYHTKGLPLRKLAAIRNGSIVAELDNGQVFHLYKATRTTAIDINQSEGTLTLRYESYAPKDGLVQIR